MEIIGTVKYLEKRCRIIMFKKQFFRVERPTLANRSFKWMTADTEENYKKVVRTMEVPYGPDDIQYKYNNILISILFGFDTITCINNNFKINIYIIFSEQLISVP